MYLIIATNSNGIDRAFIAATEAKARKIMKDLAGWRNVRKIEVDCVMYDLLEIKTN